MVNMVFNRCKDDCLVLFVYNVAVALYYSKSFNLRD